MALNHIKDFPHMLNSLKNKKEAYLEKEIYSIDRHTWICLECGAEWKEEINMRFHFIDCPECEERYDVALEHCRFGGNKRKLCDQDNCYACFDRSFASSPKAYQWSKDNIGSARMIFKGSSGVYVLLDCECGHTYEIRSSNLSRGVGCSYCSNPPRKLCDQDNCYTCFHKSFASSPKAYQWSKDNIGSARMIFKGCSTKYVLLDCECGHTYEITPRNSSRGVGCPYCSNPSRKLCDKDDCERCFNNSFAS